MADRNPRRMSNWRIACNLCGTDWLGTETVQTMRDHFDAVHDGAELALRLVWAGRGPAPKAQPKVPG